MKKSKKKVKKWMFICFSRGALIACLIGIFIVAPTLRVIINGNNQRLSEKFFGRKAEYQGVLTLWNVDTFEGGSSSRESFLEKVAQKFEAKNKGVFIKVDNLSIQEFLALIKSGQRPNIFSFGTGLESYLEEAIDLPDNILSRHKENFISAGVKNGKIKAVAWSYSAYVLISSIQRIEKAGKNHISLKEQALDLAFDKKLKKGVKHTYSLTFGGNQYASANNIFSREFATNALEQVNLGNLDRNYQKQTTFEAYSSFVGGNSSVLLGTLRDVFRMENRKNAGKESEIIYEPLSGWTDLISYISVLKASENEEKVSKRFVEFLVSEEIQSQIADIGLLSPVLKQIYSDGIMMEIEANMQNNMVIKSLF